MTPPTDAERRRDLVIPDDPTVLSYLLSGIVQIELPRRQALLEASTTVERLEALVKLLDREVMLLASRLRLFAPEPATAARPAPELSQAINQARLRSLRRGGEGKAAPSTGASRPQGL